MAGPAPAPLDPRAALIARMAQARGLDPAAVNSIASVEGGFNGSIGDNGTSFGPFQLHQGGALPSQFNNNPQAAQQWANSPAGVQYALDAIAKVAKGLHGTQAIQAISSQFERPANVSGEVANASARYGQFGNGGNLGPAPTVGSGVATTFGSSPAQTPGATANPFLQLAQSIFSKNGQGGQENPIMQMALQRMQLGAAHDTFGPTPSPTTAVTGPPARGLQSAIVQTAQSQLGQSYQWGGVAKLGGHTDCSGLAQAVLGANGINIPRTTYDQWKTGTPVNPRNLQPGDLVFFHNSAQGPSHVGIYTGAGKFIEDPHTGAAVRVANLSTYPGFVGARRYTGA